MSCYFLDQVAVVNSKRAELDSVRKELGQAEEDLEIYGGSVPSTTPFSTTNSGSGKMIINFHLKHVYSSISFHIFALNQY